MYWIGIGFEIELTTALVSHSTCHFFFDPDPDFDLDQPNFIWSETIRVRTA